MKHLTSRLRTSRRLALVGAAVAALSLSACATPQAQTPEQVVQQRAQQRWDDLIKGDYDAAWAFTQPGYRAVIKQRDYYKQFGGAATWKAAKVGKVDCSAERCTVAVQVEASMNLLQARGQTVSSNIDETWVREGGKWWYYQKL